MNCTIVCERLPLLIGRTMRIAVLLFLIAGTVLAVTPETYLVTAASVDLLRNDRVVRQLRRGTLLQGGPSRSQPDWLVISFNNQKYLARRRDFETLHARELAASRRIADHEVGIERLSAERTRTNAALLRRRLARGKLRFDRFIKFRIPFVETRTIQGSFEGPADVVDRQKIDGFGGHVENVRISQLEAEKRRRIPFRQDRLNVTYTIQRKGDSKKLRRMVKELEEENEELNTRLLHLEEKCSQLRQQHAIETWRLEFLRTRLGHFSETGDDVLSQIFRTTGTIRTYVDDRIVGEIAAGTLLLAQTNSADDSWVSVQHGRRIVRCRISRLQNIESVLLKLVKRIASDRCEFNWQQLTLTRLETELKQLNQQTALIDFAEREKPHGFVVNQVGEHARDIVYGVGEILTSHDRDKVMSRLAMDLAAITDQVGDARQRILDRQDALDSSQKKLDDLQTIVMAMLKGTKQ